MPTDTPTVEAMVRKIAEWMSIHIRDPYYWNDQGGIAINHQDGFNSSYFGPHKSAADRERVMLAMGKDWLFLFSKTATGYACGIEKRARFEPDVLFVYKQASSLSLAFVTAVYQWIVNQEKNDGRT